ncbi:MAG: hypothetical protein H6673_02845 [Anaerolineales bacterium]|nr:hypothetical protein [Anaerolineales bacterium]
MIERPITTIAALPTPVPQTLYGRQAVLDDLRDLLDDGRPVWLYGPPGIGRRAVAATYAAGRIERGVLWFAVYHDDVLMLAERVARAYGVAALSADDLNTQLEIVRALLDKNRPLLIIEGPIAAGVLSQFLHYCVAPSVPVIIIASEATEGEARWRPLALEPLTDKHAEQLYRRVGHIEETRRTALLAPLLDYVEGYPLSLVIAGQHHVHVGVSSTHLASLLPKAPSGVESRALGIFAATHALLEGAAQGLFLLMGALFVDRISSRLLTLISGLPEATIEPILKTLVQRGLCAEIPQPDQPSLYRVDDLGRIYARRRLQMAGQLDATRQRIIKGIRRFVENFTAAPVEASFDALTLDMDHILGAARYAASQNDSDTLHHLFRNLGQHGTQNVIHARGYQGFYDRLGRVMSGKPLQFEANLALQAPEAIATTPIIEAPRSQSSLETSLQAAQENGDVMGAAQITVSLGDWHLAQQHFALALGYYRQAAQQFQAESAVDHALPVLQKLGELYLDTDEPAGASDAFNRAISLATQNTRRRGELLVLLGDAKQRLGDQDAALTAYRHAVDLLEGEREWVPTGLALGKMAIIFFDQGEYVEASVVLGQSVSLFEQAGRRDLQGQALGNLGTAFGRMGRWKEAGQRHMLALQIARELEDVDEERYQLSNLAFVAEAEGHYDWAILYNRQALYLGLEVGDESAIAQLTLDLGRLLLMDTDELQQAIVLLEASIDLSPQDEAVRLLSRARKRLTRLQDSGHALQAAEENLLKYAQGAYQ